jgi:glycosyltransferase involved in cell wall biosynthesis
LSIKHGLADVTICVVEPEKYLYLLWIPFIKVIYILHSSPAKKHTPFTSLTCNVTIGKRKKIITVSDSNKNLICQNWGITIKKRPFVHVIYNCIIENELNIMHSVKNNKQYITTLGHVIPYKNPALWLAVAKLVTSKYEHVHFVWLGNGPLWNDFKVATKETDRILFKGAVTDPMSYLKEAAIYYQPSLNETQGIAVLEAMYNYLPCVVSDTGGLPETVEHQYNGIVVNPTIVKEHVDALSILIDNPKLRVEYGLNSHKRVLDLFCFDTFKTKMDALYRN